MLTLVCYPGLWDASCAIHPRAAVDYSWQDHLRTLCKLARALHAAQPIALKVAGSAEQMHIEALATVDVEVLILELCGNIATRADPIWRDDPLWWLDPGYTPAALAPAESARTGRPSPDI
jgi:hypothetical protein